MTNLDGLAAHAEGRVSVVLRGPSGEERFVADAPTVPGIFRPVATPASTGPRRLIVEIRAPGFTADHDLGDVTVYGSAATARAANPEQPEASNRVVFLKEQQWPIEFGTALVAPRSIRQPEDVNRSGLLPERDDGSSRRASVIDRMDAMGWRIGAEIELALQLRGERCGVGILGDGGDDLSDGRAEQLIHDVAGRRPDRHATLRAGRAWSAGWRR